MDSVTNQTSVKHRRFHFGVLRFSMAQFLVALVLMLVSTPFVEEMKHGRGIEAVLLTLVLMSAVPAIGGSQRMLVGGIVLVTPALITRWLYHARPDQFPLQYAAAASLVFILYVVANLLRYILRAPRVNAEVLQAGVATYLLLGLMWAFAYILVNRLSPNSFSFTVGAPSSQLMVGFNGVYFSFITLTTVGYGDIVPVSPPARMLAMVEAMTGTIYVAVLISRLVALYSSENINVEREKENESKTA
jgi:voltage-gated potassium channel